MEIIKKYKYSYNARKYEEDTLVVKSKKVIDCQAKEIG